MKIYNSMTGKKEDFKPIDGNNVKKNYIKF